MSDNYDVLCENIKRKMEEKNITTFELADRLRITSVELSRYINGKRVPKAPLIFQMARELDCTADELMGIEGQERPDPDPGETTIEAALEWFKRRAESVPMPGARKMYQLAIEGLNQLVIDAARDRITLTDIYVRDKQSGWIHRVGDDQHDQLTIGEDGHLHYFNLHNGDGCSTGDTRRDGCGYEFVPNVDVYGFNYDPRREDRRRKHEPDIIDPNE